MNENGSDLNAIAVAAQANNASIKMLGEHLGVISEVVKRHDEKIISLGVTVDDHGERIAKLEDNQVLTSSMRKGIKHAIHTRVCALLGLEYEGNKVKDACMYDYANYYGSFSRRCYTDAKRAGMMAEDYRDTARRDYDRCMEFIEAWVPFGSTEEYKKHLVKYRAARSK